MELSMPDRRTLERAAEDRRQGKAPSTQAGEFIREEIDHIREGKHGARSAKQAIAIGLSKARRAGVKLPPPKRGASAEVKERAARDSEKGRSPNREPNPKRSRVAIQTLKREGTSAASHTALSRQAHQAAQTRGAADRRRAATKAVRTKGAEGLHRAAKKAARTRAKGRG
jgi:hypothetical protein